MRKRSISLPVVVLIAVVALVLDSFGSATAASISKAQVKKIAGKIVDKKAGGLSVAKAVSADTATNATNALNATNATNAATAANATALGGVPAANYSRRIFARVNYTTANPTLAAGSPGVTVSASETALGFAVVNFAQSMDNCAVVATTVSAAGTQIVRRSTGFTGTSIQFAIKDDAGAAVRANFDVIGVC